MAPTVKAAGTDGAHRRSFREFINGEVDIETGRITGRTALWQVATMPGIIAIGGAFMLTCAALTPGPTRAGSASEATPAQIPTAMSTPAATTIGGVSLQSVNVDFPDSDRTFPGGHAADAVNNNCVSCHSAGMVLTQPGLSRSQWQAEVDKMRNTYKAPISATDVRAIVDYLANLKPKS
jgi:mono/diheme cytochrome c family protein